MVQVIVAALFALVLGLAFLLYGYRLFLVMLPIWGFFAGFWMGAQGIQWLLGQGFLATTTGWVMGFILGLIFAVLSYLFYVFGVGIVAAGFGASLGSGLMAAMGFDPGFLMAVVALVSAVVVAGITLFLNIQKYVLIFMTALGGANAIVLGFLLLFNRVDLAEVAGAGSSIRPILHDSFLWGVIWLGLAVIGLLWQIRANRNFVFEKESYVVDWGSEANL